MDILGELKNTLTFIATHIKSEYVALFSVMVTIIIYIFNRKILTIAIIFIIVLVIEVSYIKGLKI